MPYAERWVRSVKEECLSRGILFGERSLRRALSEYVDHYHGERNHQGKSNVLLFPGATRPREGPVQCRERLGGLLRYYHREVARSPNRQTDILALRDDLRRVRVAAVATFLALSRWRSSLPDSRYYASSHDSVFNNLLRTLDQRLSSGR